MKRYLAFYGRTYYAEAAMGDFVGDFDTEDEARAAIDAVYVNEIGGHYDYRQRYGIVWDSELRNKVFSIGETYS